MWQLFKENLMAFMSLAQVVLLYSLAFRQSCGILIMQLWSILRGSIQKQVHLQGLMKPLMAQGVEKMELLAMKFVCQQGIG